MVAQSLPNKRKIQGFAKDFPIFPILSCGLVGLSPRLRAIHAVVDYSEINVELASLGCKTKA